MKYWFTNYHGSDWSETIHGYNQRYGNTVELIRNWFGLWQSSDGSEVASDWALYHLGQRGRKRLVDVFVYNFISQLYGRDLDGHPFVRFRLYVKLRWFDTKEVFANKELIIEFPNDYPVHPPVFYIEDYEKYGGSHDHHTLPGGEVCTLKRSFDWHGGDTIVSAISVALDHIVEHYQKFGV